MDAPQSLIPLAWLARDIPEHDNKAVVTAKRGVKDGTLRGSGTLPKGRGPTGTCPLCQGILDVALKLGRWGRLSV